MTSGLFIPPLGLGQLSTQQQLFRQRFGQGGGGLVDPVLGGPHDRRPHIVGNPVEAYAPVVVVLLPGEHTQPVATPGPVPITHGVGLPGAAEPFVGVLPDRLQYPVAGRLPGRHDQQMVVGQPGEGVGDVGTSAGGLGDRGGGVHIEPGREHRHRAEQGLVGRAEQGVAPRDRVLQRAVSIVAARSAGEVAQPVVETGEQSVDPEGRVAARGQLDGQRHAVQRAAQDADLTRVDLRGAPGGRGPLQEQANRIAAVIAHRQAGDLVHPLVRRGEPDPARDDHVQRRTGRQQPLHAGAGGAENVLAVVQHQHAVTGAQRDRHRVDQRTTRRLHHADRRGDRGDHHVRVGDPDQVDEPPSLAAGRGELPGDQPGQPGLADPTRPGDRDHSVLGDGGQQGVAFGLTADERGDLGRPAGRGRAAGRCRRAAPSGRGCAGR